MGLDGTVAFLLMGLREVGGIFGWLQMGLEEDSGFLWLLRGLEKEDGFLCWMLMGLGEAVGLLWAEPVEYGGF